MDWGKKALVLMDRTVVLFIGLTLGAVITFSFFAPAEPSSASGTTPAVIAAAGPAPAADAAPSAPANAVAPNPVATPIETAFTPGLRLASAAAEGRTVHVGVFGDSFGDGLWSALYHQLPRSQDYQVHQFSHQATGFTRYRSTNLLDDTREKLDRQPIEIAVVSFGANDTQGIYHEGRGAPYMSERWQQIVTERVTAVINLLRERGATVYWVGLPRMREADYDGQIQAMNRFYADRMRALNVPFIDTRTLTVDASGGYAPYLVNPSNGERVNARANDGIHMTIPGYGLLTRGLADNIRGLVSQARAQAGRSPQEASRPAAARDGSQG